jgi:hypothetical protein
MPKNKNYSGNTSGPHKTLGGTTGKGGSSAFGANTKNLQHTGGNKGVIHRNPKTNMKPGGSGSIVR